jgi:hypothetical protein
MEEEGCQEVYQTSSGLTLIGRRGKSSTDSEQAFTAELDDAAAAAIGDTHRDPRTIDEAQSRADWHSWKAAMDREINTLREAGTWETVPWPTSKNMVSCK